MATKFTSSGIYLSHTYSSSGGTPSAPDTGATTYTKTSGSAGTKLPSSGTYVCVQGNVGLRYSGGTNVNYGYLALKVE